LWQNNAAYTGNNAAHFRIVNERTTTGTIGGIQFARTNTADAANAIALIRAEYVGSGRGRFSFSTSPNAGNNTVRMFINYNGHVGIGTTNNPAQRLHVQGNILASGTITPSDARFKRNVQTISSPLSIVNQLRGVSYEFRTNEFPDREFNEGRQFGVIAQEVERVLPELIFDAGDGYKAVNYIGLIPVLLQAIQELSAEVEALRRQINN